MHARRVLWWKLESIGVDFFNCHNQKIVSFLEVLQGLSAVLATAYSASILNSSEKTVVAKNACVKPWQKKSNTQDWSREAVCTCQGCQY